MLLFKFLNLYLLGIYDIFVLIQHFMFNSFISVKVFHFQYTIQYTYKIKTISRQKFSKVKDCRSEKNVTQLNLGNKQCACNAITHRKLPRLYVISFARIYAAAIDQCNAWDPYIHRKIMCKCVATSMCPAVSTIIKTGRSKAVQVSMY